MAPGKPSERSFEQLMELIDTHKNPRPSTIVQRFHFHSRDQGPTETTCNFEDILDDILVRGLRDIRPQRRLLAEKRTKPLSAMHTIHFRQKGLSSDPQGKTDSFKQSPMIR